MQIMKKVSKTKCLIYATILIMGYIAGAVLQPRISAKLMKQKQTKIDIEAILSQNLVDMKTEKTINIDTLSYHKVNLLIFWAPTCKYCKQFFQNRLNATEIGIFCIPLTDDIDYTKYFVEQNEIQYMQVCVADTNGISPVKALSVEAIPTFIILDNKGKIIEQKKGIADIDLFIDKLYSL